MPRGSGSRGGSGVVGSATAASLTKDVQKNLPTDVESSSSKSPEPLPPPRSKVFATLIANGPHCLESRIGLETELGVTTPEDVNTL